MRILFVDQFSEFGGAQFGLRDVLDETVRRGWQAALLAPGNGPLHGACGKLGIPSSPLPLPHYANGHKSIADIARYGFDSLRAGLEIRKAAKRLKADLIYINGPRALPAAVVATVARSTPILFHAHSYLDRQYTRRIARWCIERRQIRVLAISQFAARPFTDLANAGLRIVYNGVRDHGFTARPRPPAQSPRIGIIGRISHEKGHLDFVRAARLMAASHPGLRFVVYGAALFSDAAYEREVRAAASGAPVDFLGWTDDVPVALREIDILAVPSGPAEGATRVIMEAFSSGTPVVAYPSGGIPELVTQRETGTLTLGTGPEPLAKALAELLARPALMAEFSAQGRQEWKDRFQLERCQREVCDFVAETATTWREACATGLKTTTAEHS